MALIHLMWVKKIIKYFVAIIFIWTAFPSPLFAGKANGDYTAALSSAEIVLSRKLGRKFDDIKKDKYSKKFIFAAVADVADGRLIYTNSPEFYRDRKIAPGSIIKIFDYALILEHIKNAEYNRFYCKDNLFVDGRRYNCSLKRGHGEVCLESALYRSCNLYFKNYMSEIPRKEFVSALKKCAFINEIEEKLILAASLADYLQSAIGDRIIKITPEKLLGLMRFLASEGFSADPGPAGYREVFSRECVQKLNAALRLVASRGTASAALEGIDCAAKTGSASVLVKIENNRKIIYTTAVFLGYAPYARPRYAVITYCDRGTGGIDAAYIAKEMFLVLSASNKN
jgi:cell division protein FtsI/penicillin-binding protein 2